MSFEKLQKKRECELRKRTLAFGAVEGSEYVESHDAVSAEAVSAGLRVPADQVAGCKNIRQSFHSKKCCMSDKSCMVGVSE